MSGGEVEVTALTVNDYEHPEWCDVSRCEPCSGVEGPYGLHYSTGTTWGVQTDEADVTVALVLGDDMLGGDNHGRTRIRFTLQEWASFNEDGGNRISDAEMDPDDARMLARILDRYADRADRANSFPWRGSVKEARHRA